MRHHAQKIGPALSSPLCSRRGKPFRRQRGCCCCIGLRQISAFCLLTPRAFWLKRHQRSTLERRAFLNEPDNNLTHATLRFREQARLLVFASRGYVLVNWKFNPPASADLSRCFTCFWDCCISQHIHSCATLQRRYANRAGNIFTRHWKQFPKWKIFFVASSEEVSCLPHLIFKI